MRAFFSACVVKKVEPIFSSEENAQMRKIVSPPPRRNVPRLDPPGVCLQLQYVMLSVEPIHFPKELAFLGFDPLRFV